MKFNSEAKVNQLKTNITVIRSGEEHLEDIVNGNNIFMKFTHNYMEKHTTILRRRNCL